MTTAATAAIAAIQAGGFLSHWSANQRASLRSGGLEPAEKNATGPSKSTVPGRMSQYLALIVRHSARGACMPAPFAGNGLVEQPFSSDCGRAPIPSSPTFRAVSKRRAATFAPVSGSSPARGAFSSVKELRVHDRSLFRSPEIDVVIGGNAK